MDHQRAFEINRRIRDYTSALQEPYAYTLNVDTFHHAYMQFDEKFRWPSVNLSKVDSQEAAAITEVLLKYAPFAIKNCQILPDPRSGRYSHHLFYVKKVTEEPIRLIYIFRVSCQYMGGADSGEIIKPAKQGFSPEILTDRVYFASRLLPVQSLTEENGSIIDFQPLKLRDAVFHISNQNPERDIWSTILFDEVDFSSVNRKFSEIFGFGESWPAERLFLPFVVDSLAIACNLILLNPAVVSTIAHYYARLLHVFLQMFSTDKADADTVSFWRNYYTGWKYERILSKSGNPHWQLTGSPNLEKYIVNL